MCFDTDIDLFIHLIILAASVRKVLRVVVLKRFEKPLPLPVQLTFFDYV